MVIKKSSDVIIAPIYIVSMMVAFTTQYGDYRMGFFLQMVIGLFWILFAVAKLLFNWFKFNDICASDYKWLIKIYLIPHIVIHLYTIFLMCIGKVEWKYFTTNVTVYVPTLLAIFSLYLFGFKALNYNFIALLSSWCLSVLVSVVEKGFVIFPNAIKQAYFGNVWLKNYLELHDIALAIGYIFLYYVYVKKLTVKRFFVILLILLLMGLSMKRITILALFLAGLFHWMLRPLNVKSKYKVCIITGVLGFIGCYLFIYYLSNGDVFYNFLKRYKINAMGRTYYFKAIMNYAEFKPSFMGVGRNVVTRLLTGDELSYLRVGGVHSDIIKMYVENGFIMFGLWLWYYLIYVTKKYKKRYGVNEAVLYFVLVIYTFVLYLTDNTEIYFICQIFSIIIPASYALYGKGVWENDQKIVKKNIIS